jgi:hypothetical protein
VLAGESRSGKKSIWTYSQADRLKCTAASWAKGGSGVTERLRKKTDGSGTATLRVEVSKLLREYFANLAELYGDEEAAKSRKIFLSL